MKNTNYLMRLVVCITAAVSLPSLAAECINAEPCPNQIERLESYASDGSPEAQLLLGALLDDGAVVIKNEEKAFYWFKSAAAKTFNYPTANFFTGRGYLFGRGVEQDLKLAKFYLKKSAKSGYPPAQQLLGLEYLNGENFSQDLYAARRLLEKAANENAVLAAFYVANMYEEGAGGEKDEDKAKQFYLLAARHNLPQAIAKLELHLSDAEMKLWKSENLKSAESEIAKLIESGGEEVEPTSKLKNSHNELASLEPSLNRIEHWLVDHKNRNLGAHDRCGAGCEAQDRFKHLKNTSLDFGYSTGGRYSAWNNQSNTGQ